MEKIGNVDDGQGVLVKMSRSEWGQIEHLKEIAAAAFGTKLESRSHGDLTPLFRAIDRWVDGGFHLVKLRKWVDELEKTLLETGKTE